MTNQDELKSWTCFPTLIYTIEKPEFIQDVTKAAEAALPEDKTLDDTYPVLMSSTILDDPQARPFLEYAGSTSWNILNSQGYDMNNFDTYFTEMWMQAHYKHSLMEQHTHAFGVQMVGFYFLETPENCSNLQVHDPRPAKVQINLPQKDISQVSPATDIINITPTPGLLVFTNAWLHHSFGRHASDEPIKFIHFNVGVNWNPKINSSDSPAAEII